jgi:hypothetical protein
MDFLKCRVVIFSIFRFCGVEKERIKNDGGGSSNWVNCKSLLIVDDHLRRRFVHFKPGAYLLDSLCLFVEPRSKLCHAPIEILARVAAQLGEPDRAIAALQKLLSIPSEGALASRVPLTPALLRLDPMFDPLRNDPRFQELILEPVPKPF